MTLGPSQLRRYAEAIVKASLGVAKGDFLLVGPGLEIRRALEISGLDRHFAVHDTLEDALTASL